MPNQRQAACVTPCERESSPESGYMLVAVIVMTALVLIALSAAAPIISKDLRRDKEVESEHRAEQYVRAIRLYYRKTHAYPPSIDALKNTNNVRFLRQEYVDPLTGKSDWKLIHLGEQKTTVKGFFGQELGGIGGGSGGLGSAAGMSSGIGTPIGGAGSSSQNCVSGGTALTSGFTGACQTTTSGAGGSTGPTGSTGSTSAFGGSGTSAFGSSGSTGSSGGLGGGGAIIGVSTARTGTSMTQPNQQSTYETWEFWYDPRIEQLYQKGITNMGIGGGAPGSTPTSSFGTGTSGLPGSSSFGSSPTSGTSPGALNSPTSSTPSTTTTPQP